MPSEAQDGYLAGTLAVLVRRGEVETLDLTDPADPAPLGRLSWPSTSFQEVERVGDHAYVTTFSPENDIRIVDLAVVGVRRGQGIGSRLLEALVAEADAAGRSLSIHVEMFNEGARRLYERFGFRLAEDKGVYLLLARPPGGVADGRQGREARR